MPEEAVIRFGCDAMLGGLARWLRAAGYDASWRVDISDPELIQLCAREGRVLLTSDTGILHYRLVRDGRIPALFLPHRANLQEQLTLVLNQLELPLREPRCMSCGGQLQEVARDQVRERVPVRSFTWLERFWECQRCGKVFWHGTHWQRITERLHQAVTH